MKLPLTLSHILIMCILCSITLFSSCGKDDSGEPTDRDNIVGIYDGIENCLSTDNDYRITIIEGGGSDDEVFISNFYSSGTLMLMATVDRNNVTIPSQEVTNISSIVYMFSGTGSISGDVLTINFEVATSDIDGNAISNEICNAVFTKR